MPTRRYKDCEPLLLTAPNGSQFRFPGVRELLKPGGVAVDTALLPPDGIGAPAAGSAGGAAPPAVPPLSGAQLANQVRLHMRRSIASYYEGRLRSDDDLAPCDTRNVCLAVREDARPGTVPPDARCTGTMRQVVTEAKLYTQVGGRVGMLGAGASAGSLGVWLGWWGGAQAGRVHAGTRYAGKMPVHPPWLSPSRPAAAPALTPCSCRTSTACVTWRACCTRWTAARRRRRRWRSWRPSGAARALLARLGGTECQQPLLLLGARASPHSVLQHPAASSSHSALARPPAGSVSHRRAAMEEGARAAAALRDASGFRWVDLGSMFGRLAAAPARA